MNDKRIVVKVPQKNYLELRAKLILRGITVADWIRELIQKEITKPS